LGPAGVPVGDWDRGIADLCFSLQLRRPTKKSQGNETQDTVLYPMSKSYNLHIFSYFTFTSLLITNLSFLAGGELGGLSFFICLKVTQILLISFIFVKSLLHNL
jgi:hypothetical protein